MTPAGRPVWHGGLTDPERRVGKAEGREDRSGQRGDRPAAPPHRRHGTFLTTESPSRPPRLV
jgi:hypothetical protein